jgi:polysaccharide biosynthesis protein PslJ
MSSRSKPPRPTSIERRSRAVADADGGRSWTAVPNSLGIFFAALGVAVFESPSVVANRPLAFVLLLASVAVFLSKAIRWESLVALLIGVIFFIPIKRYTLPAALPFNLEPYRILVAAIVAVWLVALLVDPRVRLRRSGYDAPIIAFLLVALFSLVVNPGRLRQPGVSVEAIKTLTFFLSFVLVFYVVVSVVRSRAVVDLLVKGMVGSGAVVAAFAVIENRTGYNIFDHLGFLPLLTFHNPNLTVASLDRGGGVRVYASAQHPIALAAVLVMLIPLGVYLARTNHRYAWGGATAVMALGAAATVSRTAVLMLAIELIVLLIVRPREGVRVLAAVPFALVLALIVAPNSVKGLYDAFAPHGGLIQQQTQIVAGSPNASPRLADLGPSLHQFAHHPILGIGFGTRVLPTDYILDDQWLGSLLEIGAIGVFVLVWLFHRSLLRLGRVARSDASPRGALCAAFAASVAAFGAGMLTFDAFSFIQVTYVFFVVLALGAVLIDHPVVSDPPSSLESAGG